MKKSLVLALTACLLTGSLAGCKGAGGDQKETAEKKETAKTETQADTQEETGAGTEKGGESGTTTEAAGSEETGAGENGTGDVTWEDTLTIPALVGPLINDGVRNQMTRFEEKYNVEFEVEQVSDDNFSTLVTARAATGELDGLVEWHSGAAMSNIAPTENLEPVTGEAFLDNLEDIYRKSVELSGETFGVPIMPVYAGGFAYNKKIYKELNLEVPKTWEQFVENCRAVKDAGYTAVVGSFDTKSTAQMIWLTDFYNVHCEYPEFEQDYTANKVRLKDIPSYVDSFRKMEDVSSNGFYNEDYLSTNREQAISMLAEGKGAHYCLLTRELVNVLAANYPDAIGDIGFFATPGNDPDKTGITVWMPHSWYIAKNASEDVKTALKLWMTYVTSQEGLDAYFEKQSMAGPVMVKGARYPTDMYECVKEAISYYDNGSWYPAQEFVTPIKGASTPNICVEAASGAISPEEAVQQIDDDNAKVAIQLGLEGWK